MTSRDPRFISIATTPRMVMPIQHGPVTLRMRQEMRRLSKPFRFVAFMRGHFQNFAIFELKETTDAR